MANEHTSTLQVSGTGIRRTNVWFRPNGALAPVAFGGPFVTGITRPFLGRYMVTLTGLSPRAFISAEVYAYDNAVPSGRDGRFNGITINAAAGTAVIDIATIQAIGGNVNADFVADPLTIVKLGLLWKVFSGRDSSSA